MRFLRSIRAGSAVTIGATWLSLNCSALLAAPASTQVVVEATDVDLAKLHSGAEVVFVSSGQRLAVGHAIDDDRRTIYQFSDSDPRPTMIVKLIDTKPIHRVSVVTGSESGKVDVYLLGEIPQDLAALDKQQPVGSIVDLGVAREKAVEFSPQSARYVALRWALSNNHLQPLAVAEVSVFGTEAADANAVTLAATHPPPTPMDATLEPPVIASISP